MIEVGRNRYFDHNVGMQSSGGVELRSGNKRSQEK